MSSRPEPVEDGVPMSFLDNLKKKAEELDLETKAKQLQETATQAAKQAREKAGHFAVENREKIDGYVETASDQDRREDRGQVRRQGRQGQGAGRPRRRQGRGGPRVQAGAGARERFRRGVRRPARPTREALADTTLEDTVLGLDHLPTAPAGHQDAPAPEDADAGPRGTQPPHDGTN